MADLSTNLPASVSQSFWVASGPPANTATRRTAPSKPAGGVVWKTIGDPINVASRYSALNYGRNA